MSTLGLHLALRRFVLGAGRLRLQKDFPTLVRAFAQARAVREMRLMILGGRQDERKGSQSKLHC